MLLLDNTLSTVARGEMLAYLNSCATTLSRLEPPPGYIHNLTERLAKYRSEIAWEQWRDFATCTMRAHSILPLLHREPFSNYGFTKPRGYPGDAVLMDFGYGGGASTPFVEKSDALGRELYRQCFETPAHALLRERRDFLAQRLDCAPRSSHILAVACGHLRELSRLPDPPAFARFVAIDQDRESLKTAEASLPGAAIEFVGTSAYRLLSERFDIGTFDLIYSAGLLDYVDDDFAVRLVKQLALRLNRGGTLLLANMLPAFSGAGYIEAVMDWWLIYRTAEQMMSLTAGIAQDRRFTATTFEGSTGEIVYLEVRRA